MTMEITFVLPRYLSAPAGGFKVVYEYANHLQARGHRVTVVHPRNVSPQTGLLQTIKSRLWPYKIRWRDGRIVPWFPIREDVRTLLVRDLREGFIPDGDVIFATGYQTAFWVSRYAVSKGRKYYLVQHHEVWDGPEDKVNRTWVLPLHKVVIAHWLLNLAEELGEGERATYIPNGIDFTHFKMTTPISVRPAHRVAMMAHPSDWKGTPDGLAALETVRKQVPELEAVLFGTHRRPPNVPEWITYVQQPSANELPALYNSCSIFLHPSWTEGWGLPSAEAMSCGCALVAAANQGVLDFANHEETALLAPIKQPAKLAEQLLRAVRDDRLRIRIAEAGNRHIQQYTWKRAVDSLEQLLLKHHESESRVSSDLRDSKNIQRTNIDRRDAEFGEDARWII
jgi:glycosyltransferase involved in cell wall biosynthesis